MAAPGVGRRRHLRAGARARTRASAGVQGGVRTGANRLAGRRVCWRARQWQLPAQALRRVSGVGWRRRAAASDS